MLPPPSSSMGSSASMDSPNPTPGGQPLVGPPQGDPSSPQPAAPSQEQQSQAFMQQVREITMAISGMARNFPAGAQDFELAIQNMITGMTKTVISQSNTEPSSAPNLLG